MAIARSSFASRWSSGGRWTTSRTVCMMGSPSPVLENATRSSARSTSANSRSSSSPLARGEPDDVDAVRKRSVHVRELLDSRQYVLRLVGDPLDPVGVVLPRPHQPEIPEAEVLHRPHHVGDVDEILGLVQDDDDHNSNAKFGMRNAEWKDELPSRLRIPHSAFRIGIIPPTLTRRAAPDPAGPPATTPSRRRRSTPAGPRAARGPAASR